MISTLTTVWQNADLRKRIFYTLALLAVYRLGVFVTMPGIDRGAMKAYLDAAQSQGGGFLNLFNFFSGGAIEQASIFALGIMPYITASIIMSLLTVAIPTLERLQKEGEQGRRRINQYTRYGTVLISVMHGVILSSYLKSQTVQNHSIVAVDWAVWLGGTGFVLMSVITLSAGTAFIMWLGERITERGVGNGISLIIFAGIVARLPSAIYSTALGIRTGAYAPVEMALLGGVMLFILAGIVFVEKGQRRIPVQYAKRVVQGREYGGAATHLPLKVNVAGVIPPIFASTILMFPMTLASMVQAKWIDALQGALNPSEWLYQVLFVSLIIFFAYFYTAVQFNPVDVADNMRKFGGFIPGVRPGRATADKIDYVLTRITFGGAIYLSAVCVAPVLLQRLSSNQVPFYFGGTGLLIVVSVALETVEQIRGYTISSQYDRVSDEAAVRIRARVQAQADSQE
ncbi:MAG: preprotein translocase subunit SecY [Myxococcota bacterium]